jgi:hypothetical protein
MAFIAFSTIVATLRQSFGGHLSPLQNLLFRFYVEVGFLQLLLAFIPIALLEYWPDEQQVWMFSTYSILVMAGLYMPFYLTRRRNIDANVPLVSKVVMVGYAIAVVAMIMTATKLFWKPSIATTIYFLLWALASNIAVFLYFLSTFVEVAPLTEDQD